MAHAIAELPGVELIVWQECSGVSAGTAVATICSMPALSQLASTWLTGAQRQVLLADVLPHLPSPDTWLQQGLYYHGATFCMPGASGKLMAVTSCTYRPGTHFYLTTAEIKAATMSGVPKPGIPVGPPVDDPDKPGMVFQFYVFHVAQSQARLQQATGPVVRFPEHEGLTALGRILCTKQTLSLRRFLLLLSQPDLVTSDDQLPSHL